MRYFILVFVLLCLAVVSIAGFRGGISRQPPIEIFSDMDRQPKLRPQTRAEFFPDKLSSHLPVPGTIARSRPFQLGNETVYPFEEAAVNTGRIPGTTNFVETNPFPINAQLLARGRERFTIYCSPCHGAQGDGKGITTKLGMVVIADLHDSRTRRIPQQPDGQIFDTITHGKVTMQPYGGVIPVEDRWAIIAYVRALQRSRLASLEDVPVEIRSKLPGGAAAAASSATQAPAMNSFATTSSTTRLELGRWRNILLTLIGVGVLIAIVGAVRNLNQFAYSYLLAYVFLLSLCLGSLFLVLVHHLFDAAWSVPLRRVVEHLACLLFPVMAVLWIPIGALAPRIYPWMNPAHADHALHAKEALLNKPTWYIISAVIFLVWWLLTQKLRYWSLKQDETGSAECTYKLRFYAAWGIFAFAITTTLAIILWVKSIEHQWFSTMYGVYYFAESVWTTLATVYVIMTVLRKAGPLSAVITPKQVYFLGSLWFAFTVFYAYVHFSQYFIIWNANVPEETFWYLQREAGGWWGIGMLLIFGHFFLPFLALIRIDAKLKLWVMIPLAAWAWVMHFCDVSFNVMPTLHPKGFVLHPLDLAGLAVIGGTLIFCWLCDFNRFPPFPQKDPRMVEALGLHPQQVAHVATAKVEGKS